MTTNDQPQTIPADKVRKIIARYRDGANDQGGRILADLKALLPPPPRPTLADITPAERAACKWMQADVANRGVRYVIANPLDDEYEAGLVSADGEIEWMDPERVTPRPDLPRMEWPGDQEATDVTPAKVGTVIESADDPRLAALPVGSMLIDRDGGVFDVTKNYTGEWDGPGYVPAQGTGTKWGPWTVRRIGLEGDQ